MFVLLYVRSFVLFSDSTLCPSTYYTVILRGAMSSFLRKNCTSNPTRAKMLTGKQPLSRLQPVPSRVPLVYCKHSIHRHILNHALQQRRSEWFKWDRWFWRGCCLLAPQNRNPPSRWTPRALAKQNQRSTLLHRLVSFCCVDTAAACLTLSHAVPIEYFKLHKVCKWIVWGICAHFGGWVSGINKSTVWIQCDSSC